MSSSNEKDVKMDSFYSWVVCFVVFLNGVVVIGFYNSFGSIFLALIAEFKATESSAAWVGSFSFCILCLCLILINKLLPRFGYRAVSCVGSILFGTGLVISSFANSLPILFVTYGIIFGTGSGMVFFTGLLILPRFFKNHRGLAIGIALSGNGIGAIPFGYINEYFVKTFGLMMTFRLLALLAVPLFLGSLIYGPTVVIGKEEKSKEEKPRSIKVKKSSESILKNKALMVHALALSVNAFGYYIPAVHLVNMAEEFGIPAMKATLLPSSKALSQSAGKIAFGQIICWFRGTRTIYLLQACILVCGVATTFCPLMTNFAGFMAYTIIYGFFEGCISVSTFKIIEEVAGEKNIDAGYTVQIVGNSIFLLAGPPTAGFLKEVTGSYQVPFSLSGFFSTLCVCLMFLTPVLHKKAKRDEFLFEYPVKDFVTNENSNDWDFAKASTSSGDSGIIVEIPSDEESPFYSSVTPAWKVSQNAPDSACSSVNNDLPENNDSPFYSSMTSAWKVSQNAKVKACENETNDSPFYLSVSKVLDSAPDCASDAMNFKSIEEVQICRGPKHAAKADFDNEEFPKTVDDISETNRPKFSVKEQDADAGNSKRNDAEFPVKEVPVVIYRESIAVERDTFS